MLLLQLHVSRKLAGDVFQLLMFVAVDVAIGRSAGACITACVVMVGGVGVIVRCLWWWCGR